MKKIIENAVDQPWLDAVGDKVQPAVVSAFEAGGEAGKRIKNFLHGSWLGHPLHPILTDIPIGAYSVAAVLDGMELAGSKAGCKAADASIKIGLVGAAGAAVSGITDWTGTTKKKRRIGLLHGLLNTGAALCYLASMATRKCPGSRKTGIALAFTGYTLTVAASYLGGHLVYRKQVGVDHTATADPYPKKFVDVLPDADLKDNEMKKVMAKNIAVLLVRQNGKIKALANTCSHLGGPLNEGKLLQDGCVECPWHQSVFDLHDGHVVDGPASAPQPAFDVRVKNKMIQVRVNPKP